MVHYCSLSSDTCGLYGPLPPDPFEPVPGSVYLRDRPAIAAFVVADKPTLNFGVRKSECPGAVDALKLSGFVA